ncbi:phytoene/squalene synthase family protein [uncultured Thalassospira sp.]|uniref:phytoene/squalene synthase family protein n=1 Tax=unclassified Thalassospira TaxID=2648997 RepID=UPI002591B0BB|nr:phytoene/squalene synthase family protein [uncultured Thalassospira sp.]|tara:strand:- start:273 stop:1118 length:846 start_codon:yes stop_codon:yes gene_type:complete
MTDTPKLSHCADYTRRHDRDRFLCALFAAPEKREDLFTLYAFNQEVSKTREMVSEIMLGHIRLQWWRDTLSEIAEGKVRKHEVVEPLADLVQTGALSVDDLETVVAAREFDLEDRQPADQAELDRYIDQTSGQMAVLAARILGVTDEAGQQAVRLAGNAYGLVGIMRAMVFHGRAKRLYLPKDRMEHHNVVQSDIFEFRKKDEVRNLTRELAELAQSRIKEARKHRRAVPKGAHAAVLPMVLADGYLRKLAKAKFDPFSAEFGLARPASVRLMVNGLLKRY